MAFLLKTGAEKRAVPFNFSSQTCWWLGMQFAQSMLSERIDVLDSPSTLEEVIAVPVTSDSDERDAI